MARAVLDPDARDRLASLTSRLDVGSLAGERALEVHPSLSAVLPQGVPRGSTTSCRGQSPVSAACLVMSAASQAGAWIGVAGVSSFGLQAAAEAGLALERVLAVRDTAEFGDDTWGQVLGALVDGVDIVLFGGASRVRPGTARRVQARVQHRGAVLVLVGDPGAFSCDLVVDTRSRWEGLASGHGRLVARQIEVSVEGRRVPRPRRDTIWFPDPTGRIERATAATGSTGSTGNTGEVAQPGVAQPGVAQPGVAQPGVAGVTPLRRTG